MSAAERLLCMLNPGAMNPLRLQEGSSSTSPMRTDAMQVRAALEAMRPRVLCTALLLRHIPEMIHTEELRVYQLHLLSELQERQRKERHWTRRLLQQAAIVRAAVAETVSPERVCRACAGEGTVPVRVRGLIVRTEPCQACDGTGLRRWRPSKRRRAAGIKSESTWLRSCADPHDWLVRYIEQHQREGERVLIRTLGREQ
jgi:hypothetical protein